MEVKCLTYAWGPIPLLLNIDRCIIVYIIRVQFFPENCNAFLGLSFFAGWRPKLNIFLFKVQYSGSFLIVVKLGSCCEGQLLLYETKDGLLTFDFVSRFGQMFEMSHEFVFVNVVWRWQLVSS